jgi:hypothetical protein
MGSLLITAPEHNFGVCPKSIQLFLSQGGEFEIDRGLTGVNVWDAAKRLCIRGAQQFRGLTLRKLAALARCDDTAIGLVN